MSSIKVFIARPLLGCSLKFSGILSIMIVLFPSLPIFDKSLIKKKITLKNPNPQIDVCCRYNL